MEGETNIGIFVRVAAIVGPWSITVVANRPQPLGVGHTKALCASGELVAYLAASDGGIGLDGTHRNARGPKGWATL
jgi:hypothetical protein